MEARTETTSFVKLIFGCWLLAILKLSDGDDWKKDMGAATCTPLTG